MPSNVLSSWEKHTVSQWDYDNWQLSWLFISMLVVRESLSCYSLSTSVWFCQLHRVWLVDWLIDGLIFTSIPIPIDWLIDGLIFDSDSDWLIDWWIDRFRFDWMRFDSDSDWLIDLFIDWLIVAAFSQSNSAKCTTSVRKCWWQRGRTRKTLTSSTLWVGCRVGLSSTAAVHWICVS